MKLKLGDKAIIGDNTSGHEFNIGEEVTIKELFSNSKPPHYACENERGQTWYLGDDELGEPIANEIDILKEQNRLLVEALKLYQDADLNSNYQYSILNKEDTEKMETLLQSIQK